MICPINRNELTLRIPCRPATADDVEIARNLKDTFQANRKGCVGMAANMIGERVRIIVFDDGGTVRTMLNPEITSKAAPYEAEEGCLSLSGTRAATRYRSITVSYQDESMKKHTVKLKGYAAQIAQHEIDHCNGIVI